MRICAVNCEATATPATTASTATSAMTTDDRAPNGDRARANIPNRVAPRVSAGQAAQGPPYRQDLRRSGGRQDRVHPDVRLQHLGDVEAAVGPLVGLEDRRDDPGEGEARAVEGVDELRLRAGLGPVADRHPAGLVVPEVRAGADLEPTLHARRPDLEVVLLRLHEAHLAR